jgi:hypothetical protein
MKTKMSEPKNSVSRVDHQPLVVPLLPWPDRCGFWWMRHKWGMELSEAYRHEDPEEDESEFAIRTHNGGEKSFEPNMPRDLDGGDPQFAWLGASFDSFLHNAESIRAENEA